MAKKVNLKLFILVLLSLVSCFLCLGCSVSKQNEKENSYTVITGNISSGAIYNELVRYNISPLEILSLAQNFKSIYNLSGVDKKDTFKVIINTENQIIEFQLKKNEIEIYNAQRTTNDTFFVYKESVILTSSKQLIQTTLSTSVYEAIVKAGGSDFLAMTYFDIFAWDIDFILDPREGDKITLLYEQDYKDDLKVGYPRILTAKFEGQERSASAYPFVINGKKQFFDQAGRSLRKMFLRMPLNFGIITSHFSSSRLHPVLKYTRAHTGIDYGAPHGALILATADGYVSFVGWKGGYGKLVIIQHANGYATYYGHCSSYLVKQGQRVRQGQGIARVGATGLATGPHVHYEVRINNSPINPLLLKSTKGSPIPTAKLPNFKITVQTAETAIKDLNTPPIQKENKKPKKKINFFKTLFSIFIS